jgi:DNA polymerase elongation subunit (family B)
MNADGEGDSTKDKGAANESNTAVPLTFELSIYILPGETQTVRIVGMYFENPLHAPSDKTILDAVLYKTATAYNLLDMMQDDGSAE